MIYDGLRLVSQTSYFVSKRHQRYGLRNFFENKAGFGLHKLCV